MKAIYKSVRFTKFYNNPSCDYGWITIYAGDEELCNHRIEYEAAVKEVYKFARKLEQPLVMINNPYEPLITTVEITGYLV